MARILYVYIVTNRSGTLYVGVTNNPCRRIAEHRSGKPGSFTHRYRMGRLVYVEAVPGPLRAIAREKAIKGWTRARKIALICSLNPEWRDLAEGWG